MLKRFLRFSEGAELWTLDSEGARISSQDVQTVAHRHDIAVAAVLHPFAVQGQRGKKTGAVVLRRHAAELIFTCCVSREAGQKKVLVRRSLFDPDNETAMNLTKASS